MTNRYACAQPGCPRRPAVTAETAPICYTCGRAMAEVARPVLIMEEPYIYEEPEYIEYPRIPVPHPAPDVAEALRRHGMEPAPVQSLYISLHDRLAGEHDLWLGPELSYPGYRRMRVIRGADGRWPEEVVLDFPQDTHDAHWAQIFGISHSETGKPLYYDEIYPRGFPISKDVTLILTLPIRGIAALGATNARRRMPQPTE
jgi:hypothetical protein